MSHPKPAARKAAWKVEYETKVAAMSNADLLSHAMSDANMMGSDMANGRDQEREEISTDELTRRLTAIGFLPEQAPHQPAAESPAP